MAASIFRFLLERIQQKTVVANMVTQRTAPAAMIPSNATRDRPPRVPGRGTTIFVAVGAAEEEVVGRMPGILLYAAREAEAVKPKGFVVGSEASVLPIAVT